MKKITRLLLLSVLVTHSLYAQTIIKAKNAYKYLGQTVIVHDSVCSTINSHYAQMFFLFMGVDDQHKDVLIKITPGIGMNNPTVLNRYLPKGKTNIKGCFIYVKGLVEGTKSNPYILVKDTSQFVYSAVKQ